MTETAHPPRKTISDFLALPEGTRAEFIDGEITLTPAPFLPHQRAVLNLSLALTLWARSSGAGCVVVAPMDVHLPSGDVVQPDVIFVAERNASILVDWIRGVPDLLIEVLSPSDPARDRVLKRSLYAHNGVPAYWIVDPALRTIEALHPERGAFRVASRLAEGGVLSSPSLPGFTLPLAEAFRA
jgi:Uma2 family endonuclease